MTYKLKIIDDFCAEIRNEKGVRVATCIKDLNGTWYVLSRTKKTYYSHLGEHADVQDAYLAFTKYKNSIAGTAVR
jgi:hypothetical protein